MSNLTNNGAGYVVCGMWYVCGLHEHRLVTRPVTFLCRKAGTLNLVRVSFWVLFAHPPRYCPGMMTAYSQSVKHYPKLGRFRPGRI